MSRERMDDSQIILVATIGWLIVWFGFHWSLGSGGVVISILFVVFVLDVCAVFPAYCVEKYGASRAVWMIWGYAVAPYLISVVWLFRRNRRRPMGTAARDASSK